jgi:hypothetical protein
MLWFKKYFSEKIGRINWKLLHKLLPNLIITLCFFRKTTKICKSCRKIAITISTLRYPRERKKKCWPKD